ncbi:MAG: hypothetical protein ACM3U1_09710 [Chloroflexota bacterium]
MSNIEFLGLYTDTIRIGYGEQLAPSYSLFNDIEGEVNPKGNFSTEHEIVEFYFNLESDLHHLITNDFCFEPVEYLKGVKEPFYGFADSDIDLILVHPCISNSVVIEFKRIADLKYEKIYIDFEKIKKLVQQSNARYKLKFHKVYAGLIIDVWGLKQVEDNIFNRDVSSEYLEKLNSLLNEYGLHPYIGIFIFQNIWTSNKSIQDQNAIEIAIYREAFPKEQHPHTTENIICALKIQKEK